MSAAMSAAASATVSALGAEAKAVLAPVDDDNVILDNDIICNREGYKIIKEVQFNDTISVVTIERYIIKNPKCLHCKRRIWSDVCRKCFPSNENDKKEEELFILKKFYTSNPIIFLQ